MISTQLSSKGQIVIPKALRDARDWAAGTQFVIEPTDEGLLLREVHTEAPIALKQGLALLRARVNYRGPKISVAQMNQAIDAEARRRGLKK
jgi:AbrB family looped-hinge helix DNA binding protein